MSSIRARSPVITGQATPEELSSLTGTSSSTSDEASSRLTGKRKEHPNPKGRFKMVGNVVLAMQRFQASLNPTVTFGKAPPSPGGSHSSHDGIAPTSIPAAISEAAAASSSLRPSDTCNNAKLQKGQSRNRFATVMQPLPPTDT